MDNKLLQVQALRQFNNILHVSQSSTHVNKQSQFQCLK